MAKVLARGQITLPREIRKAAGVKPGDRVLVRATGPGKVELELLPRMTLAETFELWHIEEPIDRKADRERMYEELGAKLVRKMARDLQEPSGAERPD